MESPDKILEEAKESLADYCMEECHAYCCRSNYLILDKEQLELFSAEARVKNKPDGKYAMRMGKDSPCPMLSNDLKCTIHKDARRPIACSDFPIVLRGNAIVASTRCPAIRRDFLYPYISRLKKCGCEIRIIEMDWDVSDFNV